jgi:hypothetical protein
MDIGGHLVTGSDPRWKWLSTVCSIVTIVSFVAYVGLVMIGVMSVSALSQGWFILYFTAVLVAVTYVFGRETLEVVAEFREGTLADSDDDSE